jgi:AcrR family transcriptional regulator
LYQLVVTSSKIVREQWSSPSTLRLRLPERTYCVDVKTKSPKLHVVRQRGPAEHATRDQIVAAADAHFRYFGYRKTTVSDLAREIGFSKAYIYRFFDSKQAIGDAIASSWISRITTEIDDLVAGARAPTEKLRGMFRIFATRGREIYFKDNRLYDIVTASIDEGWPAVRHYVEHIAGCVRTVIAQGRSAGEFERKTPLDETCRAILQVMKLFMDPVILQQTLDDADENVSVVSSLVLRSLAH